MDSETRNRVDERFEELYRRYLGLREADGEVARYYSSELGYYQPERGADESDRSSVCLVTVDGDIHTAGDHDLTFALQSLS